MINWAVFSELHVVCFVAVLIRISMLVVSLPVLGDRVVPAPFKALFSLIVSLLVFPALIARGWVRPGELIGAQDHLGALAIGCASEALVGLILGFGARLIFDGLSFGGNLLGNLMGFSFATLYDPHQESHSQVIAQFQVSLGMLLFLAMDGHHYLLESSLLSYRTVGLGALAWSPALSTQFIQASGQAMRVGLELAAPIAATLFTLNLGLGLLSRALPQMNIFMLSAALSGLVGMAGLYLGASEYQAEVGHLVRTSVEGQQHWLRAMAVRPPGG